MTKLTRPALLAMALIACATPVLAQTDRSALIAQARAEINNDSASIQSLMSALDPRLGAPDSAWTVAIFGLAARLRRLDQEDQVGVWLRLAARHGGQWPIDSIFFPPTLTEAYDAAAQAVAASADSGVNTQWLWPVRYDPAAMGKAEAVAADPGAPSLSLAVEGRRDLLTGSSLDLPPGTYDFVASADGYDTVRVTREILPGVTTVLNLNLVPVLPAEVLTTVSTRLLQVTHTATGEAVCRTGFVASDDGLAITALSALPGDPALLVRPLEGGIPPEGASVLFSDSATGLAVLRLAGRFAAPLDEAASVPGAYTWSVHLDGCDQTSTSRTRLADGIGPAGDLNVDPRLPESAAGAPLVDNGGRLIGVVGGSGSIVPPTAANELLERARRQIAAARPSAGGGLPWKWMAAGGAVAAGITAVLLRKDKPTTGEIIITIPN